MVSFGTRGGSDVRWLTKDRLIAIAGWLHHSTWTDTDRDKRERYEAYAATVTSPGKAEVRVNVTTTPGDHAAPRGWRRRPSCLQGGRGSRFGLAPRAGSRGA